MKNKTLTDWIKVSNDLTEGFNNKYLDTFFNFDIKNIEDYRRSESAKEGWRKYRINYKLGEIREGVRNSLGLPSLDNKGFDYHK